MGNPRSRFRPLPVRGIVLQRRDLMIIEVLFLCHVMTTRMLCETFFSADGLSRCRRRLRQLYDWGFLDRAFVATAAYGSEAVYIVGKAGLAHAIAWCAEHGVEVDADAARAQSKMPNLSLLNHALQLARMYLACREHVGAMASTRMTWLFEPLVFAQFDIRTSFEPGRPAKWRTVSFRPDAALQLVGVAGTRRTVFMEADLSTETAAQIATKLEAHRSFLVSGQFNALYGETDFTTLVATTGSMAGRATNLAAIASRVEASFTLVTTLPAFIELGPLDCPCLGSSGEHTTLRAFLHDLETTGGVA